MKLISKIQVQKPPVVQDQYKTEYNSDSLSKQINKQESDDLHIDLEDDL